MGAYSEAVEILQNTWLKSFWNAQYTYNDPFAGLYSTEPSTQKTETRARFGAAAMPSQWAGDRVGKPVNEYSRDTTNLPYDSTIPFGKETIEYLGERGGEVATVMTSQAQKAFAHKAKLASALMEAGFATTCDDGQFFFDTDHAHADAFYTTSQDNDLTSAAATGTIPTAAEAAIGLRACFNKLYLVKDDRGDPMCPSSTIGNAADFIVVIPPEYLAAFRQVLVADTIAAAGDNELTGTFTLRINPYATNDEYFYMFYAASPWKPIILQEKSSPKPDSWYDESKGTFNSSVAWWGAVDYGAWQTAVGYVYA